MKKLIVFGIIFFLMLNIALAEKYMVEKKDNGIKSFEMGKNFETKELNSKEASELRNQGLLVEQVVDYYIQVEPFNPSYTATYFNNMYLGGTPVLTRTENAIEHNWSYGKPASQVNSDFFSARWIATRQMQGQYLFQVRSDDGVRIYVDNNIIINDWKNHSAWQLKKANISLSQGLHEIKVEYFEAAGKAEIHFNITNLTEPVVQPPTNNTTNQTNNTFAPDLWWDNLTQEEKMNVMANACIYPPANNTDITAPLRSQGQPSGVLPNGTSTTTISLSTDEQAICMYSQTANTPFFSMFNMFSSLNNLSHSATVSNLSDRQNYTFYTKCKDNSGNINQDDYSINFSINSSDEPPILTRTCTPAEQKPYGILRVNGSGGEGVTIAILDTGINSSHLDLQRRIIKCAVALNGTAVDDVCYDGHGHGTHTSGTAVADGGVDGLGIFGVAPNASLISVRVCSPTGSCPTDAITAGIYYATDNGANIISMSLGGSIPSAFMKTAIDYATERGVLVIASAGNSGPNNNTIGYPAGFDNVVAVGAFDQYDLTAGFSSRGNNYNTTPYLVEERDVELTAPGVGVLSTYKTGCYNTFSGTSMSSPHIAGLAAKYWQGTGSATRTFLQEMARNGKDMGIAGDDNEAGFGVPADISLASNLTPPLPPPETPPIFNATLKGNVIDSISGVEGLGTYLCGANGCYFTPGQNREIGYGNLPLNFNSSGFTIEACVTPYGATTGNYATILSKSDSSLGWAFRLTTNLHAMTYFANGNVVHGGSNYYIDNVPLFMALVVRPDGTTSGNVTFYKMTNTTSSSFRRSVLVNLIPLGTSFPVIIGDDLTLTRKMNGSENNIKVYDRVLGLTELKKHRDLAKCS